MERSKRYQFTCASQALTAATVTSAAESGCPTDGIVSVTISIVGASTVVKTPNIREPQPTNTEDDMSEEQFEKWYAQIKDERFWSFLEETDNDTHFKSKENLSHGKNKSDTRSD